MLLYIPLLIVFLPHIPSSFSFSSLFLSSSLFFLVLSSSSSNFFSRVFNISCWSTCSPLLHPRMPKSEHSPLWKPKLILTYDLTYYGLVQCKFNKAWSDLMQRVNGGVYVHLLQGRCSVVWVDLYLSNH